MKILFAVAIFLSLTEALKGERKHPLGDFVGLGPDKVQQHSGYITVNGTYKNGVHLFYWMFESRGTPSTDPLVLWLTGGPGCSSELALFYENGPYTLDNELNMTINPNSWNSFANLLYVDQPAGTGFSYADWTEDYVTDEYQVATDMYNFLVEFFVMYPQYAELPFYITGESYAGHYVPAIASRIVSENGNHTFKINIKGVAIGNGWVDPIIQYGAYSDYSYANGMIGAGLHVALLPAYIACQTLIEEGAYEDALLECNVILEAIRLDAGNFNVYDIRKNCTYPPLCYNFSNVDAFLAQPYVKKALGINSDSDWTECSPVVHEFLTGDWIGNYATDLPLLLEQPGFQVLIYSGMDDWICNWFGGQRWTNALGWSGQVAFNNATQTPWIVNGVQAGHYQSYDDFTFLAVENAGHMVPMDQPVNALAMLKTFISGDLPAKK